MLLPSVGFAVPKSTSIILSSATQMDMFSRSLDELPSNRVTLVKYVFRFDAEGTGVDCAKAKLGSAADAKDAERNKVGRLMAGGDA